MRKRKYKCLCCGYYTLDETICDICHVCGWEDTGITDLDIYDGLNHDSYLRSINLREGITNYNKYGTSTEYMLPYLRKPYPYEMQDSSDEYIIIEFDWPSVEDILNVLYEVMKGRLGQSAASLWAEEVYDNKFISNKIDGYYPIEESKGKILEKMILLDDENEDSENEDVIKIIEMMKKFKKG